MVNIQDGKTITVSVGDGSIEYFYYELGDPAGDPVVFLHTGGAGVSSYQCWHLNLDAVAEAGYHVLAVDAPGFGRSSPGNAVEGLLAFLDAHGIDRAHLVGNSGGGMTGTTFSGRYPERVRSLTISGGEPRLDTEATRPIVPTLGATARMNFAREMLAKPELTFEDMRRASGDFFYDREHPEVDVVAQIRLDTLSDPGLLQRVRDDAIAQIARGRNATPDEVFAAIKAPTYLLHGRDEPNFYSREDEPILFDAAIKVVGAIRDCRCTILPFCGHWPQLEKAEEYNRLLLGFLEDVSRRG